MHWQHYQLCACFYSLDKKCIEVYKKMSTTSNLSLYNTIICFEASVYITVVYVDQYAVTIYLLPVRSMFV